MSITEIAIKRPLLISVIFVTLIIFGFFGYSLLSYNLLPKFEAPIIKYIKSLGTWATPLKSQWFVVSSKSCSEIRDGLKNTTDQNDKILVIDVTDDDWSTSNISIDVTDP